MFVYMHKRRLHRKKLKQELDRINPDIVISMGGSEKVYVATMKSNKWKWIREFYSERLYRKNHSSSLFDKISA